MHYCRFAPRLHQSHAYRLIVGQRLVFYYVEKIGHTRQAFLEEANNVLTEQYPNELACFLGEDVGFKACFIRGYRDIRNPCLAR